MRHRRRLNPTEEQERRAAAVLRAHYKREYTPATLHTASTDYDMAIDLANRILAGEEVAEALAGTGLVVDMSPQPAQIAEIETSQGVIEVPVAEAPQFAAAAPAVDPSKFYTNGRFHLLAAFHKLDETEGLLSDYLHSLPDAEVKKIAKTERSALHKGSKDELIKSLVREASRQSEHGHAFLMHDVSIRPAEAVQALEWFREIIMTTPRLADVDVEGMRIDARQMLVALMNDGKREVARHFGVQDLSRIPHDKWPDKILSVAIDLPLRHRERHGRTNPPAAPEDDLPSFDDAVQAIDRANATARTADPNKLRGEVYQLLKRLPKSTLKQVAQHFDVVFQPIAGYSPVDQLIAETFGSKLVTRALRTEDRAQRKAYSRMYSR